eukprot:GHVN01013368.1.p1 GENE.GHVN01013368.1~~GHVN01013368.1.p1  ORF type:complete len:196 (+),score=20.99 GHVN01013368.1:37-624(+)
MNFSKSSRSRSSFSVPSSFVSSIARCDSSSCAETLAQRTGDDEVALSEAAVTTRSTRSSVPLAEGSHIVALFENRPSREVGIAALDMRSYCIELQQFTESSTYPFTTAALATYDLLKVVIPKVASDNNPLLNILISEYDSNEDLVLVDEIARRYFDETRGEEILKASNCNLPEASSKQCCLAALAAVIRLVAFPS